jgi:hypothetical protein
MNSKRPLVLLTLLLACGLIAVGCNGNDDDSGGDSSEETSATTGSGFDDESGLSDEDVSEAREQLEEECVNGARIYSGMTEAEAEDFCEGFYDDSDGAAEGEDTTADESGFEECMSRDISGVTDEEKEEFCESVSGG